MLTASQDYFEKKLICKNFRWHTELFIRVLSIVKKKMGTSWQLWFKSNPDVLMQVSVNSVIPTSNISKSPNLCKKILFPFNRQRVDYSGRLPTANCMCLSMSECVHDSLCVWNKEKQADKSAWKVHKQTCESLWLCVGASDCVCVFVCLCLGKRKRGRDGKE